MNVRAFLKLFNSVANVDGYDAERGEVKIADNRLVFHPAGKLTRVSHTRLENAGFTFNTETRSYSCEL